MKHLLLTGALFFSYIGFSQNWFLGPELGTNIVKLRTTNLGSDYQLGFNGGANIEYQFNAYFSLRSGIFASQKRQAYASNDTNIVNLYGFEDQIGIDGVNLESYTKINGTYSEFYLELPLMAAYTYKSFSFFSGPYIGYLLTARKREVKEITTPFLQAVDINEIDPTDGVLAALLPPAYASNFRESSSKAGLNLFDFGLKTGIRYQNDALGINLNYLYGFLDYQTAKKTEQDNHSFIQLTLNYNFGL